MRLTAELAALLDPTGIADVVASYAYPTCDKIKVKWFNNLHLLIFIISSRFITPNFWLSNLYEQAVELVNWIDDIISKKA